MPHAEPSQRYRRESRLLRPEQFKRALGRGAAARSAGLDVYRSQNDVDQPRLGLIVGKREVRLAVDRNRAKRALRESFRRAMATLGAQDIVIRVKGTVNRQKIMYLGDELNLLLKSLRP